MTGSTNRTYKINVFINLILSYNKSISTFDFSINFNVITGDGKEKRNSTSNGWLWLHLASRAHFPLLPNSSPISSVCLQLTTRSHTIMHKNYPLLIYISSYQNVIRKYITIKLNLNNISKYWLCMWGFL